MLLTSLTCKISQQPCFELSLTLTMGWWCTYTPSRGKSRTRASSLFFSLWTKAPVSVFCLFLNSRLIQKEEEKKRKDLPSRSSPASLPFSVCFEPYRSIFKLPLSRHLAHLSPFSTLFFGLFSLFPQIDLFLCLPSLLVSFRSLPGKTNVFRCTYTWERKVGEFDGKLRERVGEEGGEIHTSRYLSPSGSVATLLSFLS